MGSEVRAVIDVGTNSVKLLVASVNGNVVRPLEECSEQTRLGQGFYESHLLQPAAIEQTARAVAEFVGKARAWNPVALRVIATSAAREAINKAELIASIQRHASLTVTVITGEEEADWAFEGVATDDALAGKNLLVVDIGGGSTEFTAGHHGHRLFGASFKLGTVRYLEGTKISDSPGPPELEACARAARAVLLNEVKPRLQPALDRMGAGTQFVGTGGTHTIIARIHRRLRSFSRELIDGATLSREEMRAQKMRLWGMSLRERQNVIGLPPNRADVILPGVAFIDELMEVFALDTLRISTRGLRFGALMH